MTKVALELLKKEDINYNEKDEDGNTALIHEIENNMDSVILEIAKKNQNNIIH